MGACSRVQSRGGPLHDLFTDSGLGSDQQSHHLCDIERGHRLFIYVWLRLKLLPKHDLEMVSIFRPATSDGPWLVIFNGTEPQNVVEHVNADVKIYNLKNYQFRHSQETTCFLATRSRHRSKRSSKVVPDFQTYNGELELFNQIVTEEQRQSRSNHPRQLHVMRNHLFVSWWKTLRTRSTCSLKSRDFIWIRCHVHRALWNPYFCFPPFLRTIPSI